MPFDSLAKFRVIDFSSNIAGPYATKLFADAGADVIKVETASGDPLRRWSSTGGDLAGRDSALFRFLNASKRSVDDAPTTVDELIASADLVVEDQVESFGFDRAGLCARHPQLVILSISPFGLTGPLAERASTEFTIQAEAGSLAIRGLPGAEPYQAGARTTEWMGGTFAGVAALGALRRARRTGLGEHIDFSLQEVMALASTTYLDLMWGLLGRPPVTGSVQNVETPSIHRTRDGFVGFNTNTQQQIQDFLVMIERADLMATGEFNQVPDRMARLEEWEGIVNAWTATRDTAEIVELASALRVPVAPVANGKTVLEHEHLVARGIYTEDPSGGFLRPRPPYRVDGEELPPARPAPRLHEHSGKIDARMPKRSDAQAVDDLPLRGVRVLDVSNWWAGPSASHFLGCLGAEVIHVESTRKPDGARMIGGMFAGQHEKWWECSTFFLSANTNKQDLALNLNEPRGREIFGALVGEADILLENYSPRVMDGFGFSRGEVAELNPSCIYARMPAFGLDGPWRDHVGFAQTMEQLAGLAWLTGHQEDQPRIQRGPCDPLAGVHAAFAILAALERRSDTGRGAFLECAMIEGALNVAAEQVIEFTAYGNLMERQGNQTAEAAPQGLFRTLEEEGATAPSWMALSIETVAQWDALLDLLGDSRLSRGWKGADLPRRKADEKALVGLLADLFAERDRESLVEQLQQAGVPAAVPADPRCLSSHPQFMHRGTYEELVHSVVGQQKFIGMPFRFAGVERWLREPAPLLGEHNELILKDLGRSTEEIDELAASGVIGNLPDGL